MTKRKPKPSDPFKESTRLAKIGQRVRSDRHSLGYTGRTALDYELARLPHEALKRPQQPIPRP